MNNLLSVTSLRKYILPTLLILLNFILKGLFINSGDISGDEPFTIYYSQVDFGTLFTMLKTENNPPLFFLLIHYWIKVFGISAASTRFLPLVFSTLTVLFVYKTGLKFFNLRTALIASLLYTFSNFNIFFAHEARVYSLFALLTTISMYSFLSLLKDKSDRKQLIVLVLSNTLLIYSHFFGFFVLFIQTLSVLIIKDVRDTLFKKYSIVTGITALLYLPYFKLLISRFLTSSKGTWISAPNFEDLYNNLWKFSNAPVNTVFYLVLLLAALIFFLHKRNGGSNTQIYSKVVIIWFLVPFLLIFFLSFITPMFLDRYLIFISIAYYITIAIAINHLGVSNWLYYSLSIIAVFLMVITCNPKSDTNRNTKNLVNTIKQLRTKNTVIYLCPEWIDLGFVYYYNLDYFKDYKQTRSKLNAENIFPINNTFQVNDSLLSACQSVVYLDGWSAQVDQDNQIYKKLQKSFRKVELNESFHGFKVYYFTR